MIARVFFLVRDGASGRDGTGDLSLTRKSDGTDHGSHAEVRDRQPVVAVIAVTAAVSRTRQTLNSHRAYMASERPD
jgi:hypothetical protein